MQRVLPLVFLLSACSADEPPPPAETAPEGRAETQSIRNTEAVGYSGDAIADKVDAGLEAHEERVRKAGKESTEEPPE